MSAIVCSVKMEDRWTCPRWKRSPDWRIQASTATLWWRLLWSSCDRGNGRAAARLCLIQRQMLSMHWMKLSASGSTLSGWAVSKDTSRRTWSQGIRTLASWSRQTLLTMTLLLWDPWNWKERRTRSMYHSPRSAMKPMWVLTPPLWTSSFRESWALPRLVLTSRRPTMRKPRGKKKRSRCICAARS